MIKRADGSTSQRGLWDNIRANKGSGKKPTKEMLAQERKITNSYAEGGAMDTPPSCPPGYSWNGSECVKAKAITDPDEYAFRKAAYEDSLFLYNYYKNREPKKYGKARDTKGQWHNPTKTYIKTENLPPSEKKYYSSYGSRSSAWNKYINKEYDKAIETGDFTSFDKIKSPENKPISIKANISEYNMKNVGTNIQTKLRNQEPRFKKPSQPVIFVDKNKPKLPIPPKPVKKPIPNKIVKPVITNQPTPIPQPVAQENLPIQNQIVPDKTAQDQIVRDQIKLDKLPVKPIILSKPTGELVGESEQNLPPNYPIPFTGMEVASRTERNIDWDGNQIGYTLPFFRKPGHGGDLIKRGDKRYFYLPSLEKTEVAYFTPRDPYTIQDKLIRKFSKYDTDEMEGYQGGDAYYPGEIERAQEEGRRIEFQGYRNKADIARQKEYNRAYDEYEAKKGYQDMLMKMYDKGALPFASTSYRTGGQFPRPYSLPEDSFKQGGTNLHNSVYASSYAQYPAVYRNGGMTSHFYASNVPDNNISNKDLTYPENSYVYAQGGNLNNSNMNRYPAASRFLQKGSTASPLTNMMSIPAKTVAYEQGGKIYIKPENRGKFTASANRAGMGVQEFASHVLANKDDYSSTQVKRANFAHNAAGWKHAHGGHMMAAGGWPPGLKLKHSQLYVAPYYSNAMTGILAPSAEIGLQSKIGKQKGRMGWSIEPHIGYGYNTPEGKLPLSGGLDARYTGMKSPNDKGFATLDVGAGYNPAQGFGAGFAGGYNYRVFGQSSSPRGEIRAGKGSLDLMPYAGWQVGARPEAAQNLEIEGAGGENIKAGTAKWQTAPTYGLKAEAQWRPRIFKSSKGGSAPLTFFGRGDLNFNPVRGQQEQAAQYYGMTEGITGLTDEGWTYGETPVLEQESGMKFKPQLSGTLGVRMPLSRVKSYLPERKRIPAVEGGEYYEDPETAFRPDWTFASSGANTDDKGNPIEQEYSESLKDYKNRINSWGGGKLNPNFKTDWETRRELQNAAVDEEGNDLWIPNQIDFNEPIVEEEDYKYGGAMNFKYGGFNNPGFNALPKNVQAKIKARTFENGGVMPQLTEFNEGGRHEENVLGGIPQGTAQDGKLNLVEEGETKLNAANYIFSDTLKLDKGIAAAFNLPKGDVGKTFSDISKKLNRPNSRRDNDTIEQNAISRDLENLMLAQEAFKQVDLQKDIEMMKTKHPELMEAMDAAMQQQSAQQPSPEEMQQMQGAPQGAPQPGSPEEQAMMEDQMMQEQMMAQQQAQGQMSPEQMAQIPMSYGGSMFMRGGKMCYANGGRMYPNGGGMQNPYITYDPSLSPPPSLIDNPNFRPVMSPAGLRDEPMFGSQEEATTYMQNPASGVAVSQWKNPETGMGGQVQSKQYLDMNNLSNAGGGNVEIMGQGWSPGTSERQKRNALQVAGTPQFSFMQNPNTMATGYRAGGHMYGNGGQVLRSIGAGAYGVGEGLLDTLTFGLTDQITDKGYNALAGMGNRDKEDLERDRMIRGFGNTAGAIGGAVVSGGAATGSAVSEGFEGAGDGLTNIKGTNANFDKTINSLAQIGSMAGGLVGGGNPAGALKGAQTGIDAAGAATQAANQVPKFAETMMKAGQNPFLQQVTGMAGSMMQRNGGNMYKYGGSFENPRQQMYMPLDNVERAGGYLYAEGGMMDSPDNPIPLTDVPRININGKLYTMEEALAANVSGEIKTSPEEIADYFPNANSGSNNKNYEGSLEDDDTDETNIQTQDEEDLANLTFPGANSPNIITGGKGDYSDMDDLDEEILAAQNMVITAKDPKDKKDAQEYLSALKRMKTDLENRNVDLTMKQTPMQAAGLAAPIAYNLGMGLFSKPTQLKAEDYINKSRVTPYKVNVDPQLNETRLAYNAAEKGIRNAAPGSGAYLTNRANLANLRSKSIKDVLAGKENADAQLQMQADAQNAQLEAQSRGTKFAIDDWNAKSKAAKQKYLQKAIEQMGTLSQNSQAMDVQEKYMRLLSPQYGKTFEYQTIFDQLKDYYKNKKSSKE